MNLDKNLFKADYISEAREILDSLDDQDNLEKIQELQDYLLNSCNS